MQSPMHELSHGSNSSKKRSRIKGIAWLAFSLFATLTFPPLLSASIGATLLIINLIYMRQTVRTENEKQKKDIEYKVIYQIDPRFVITQHKVIDEDIWSIHTISLN